LIARSQHDDDVSAREVVALIHFGTVQGETARGKVGGGCGVVGEMWGCECECVMGETTTTIMMMMMLKKKVYVILRTS